MSRHTEDREVIQDSKHDFTKGKFYLIHLVAFCNGVTTSVDKGRAMVLICGDFCKAFDMVSYTIVFSKLESWGQYCLISVLVTVGSSASSTSFQTTPSCGAADTPGRWDAIQRDFIKLEELIPWDHHKV